MVADLALAVEMATQVALYLEEALAIGDALGLVVGMVDQELLLEMEMEAALDLVEVMPLE